MNGTAIYCAAALGVLLFGLGFTISGARKNTNMFWGTNPDPSDILYKLVRAHGNTAEYAPFLAILFLHLGAHAPAPWVVWTMIAATLSRYLFVAGVLAYPTMAKPNPLRFVGGMGTYLTGAALCYALVETL